VRKVFGATVANIVSMLLRDFVKLVLAANLIAWPVAYFAE
jgi:putative ABC transport system permease protein